MKTQHYRSLLCWFIALAHEVRNDASFCTARNNCRQVWPYQWRCCKRWYSIYLNVLKKVTLWSYIEKPKVLSCFEMHQSRFLKRSFFSSLLKWKLINIVYWIVERLSSYVWKKLSRFLARNLSTKFSLQLFFFVCELNQLPTWKLICVCSLRSLIIVNTAMCWMLAASAMYEISVWKLCVRLQLSIKRHILCFLT